MRNLRVAKQATLERGRHVHTYDATEVPPAEAVPVIREYVRLVPVTKDCWDIDENSTDEEVLAEAQGHPVFRLRAAGVRPGGRVGMPSSELG